MRYCTLALLAVTVVPCAYSQSMPGMDMSGTPMQMQPARTLIEQEMQHTTSGTSAEPDSTPMRMLMREHGGWTFMLHGVAFVSDIQQHAAAPAPPPCIALVGVVCPPYATRGGDKLFSTNWIMPMAQHRLGRGTLTLRTMLSLEPATITGRSFPELFQQGETAYGKPLVDAQHPHDLFMEVAALYDLPLAERTLLSLYVAPVGDPAIGPTAYPHRLSASEGPLAALGHHQEDSTHIAFNVATVGLTYGWFRLEQSGFHGAEPTEQRWGFQPSPNGLALDSYSTRLTIAPTRNLSGQYSIGHLQAPEALYPGEAQQRQTASIMYNRPIGGSDSGNWSSTLLWGRTKSLADASKENSYLLESQVRWHTRNYAWTRIENADRSNELLLTPGSALPPRYAEQPIGHVAAFSFGYDRDYRLTRYLVAAPGAQFTFYHSPAALAPAYGSTPFGGIAFVRFRLQR